MEADLGTSGFNAEGPISTFFEVRDQFYRTIDDYFIGESLFLSGSDALDRLAQSDLSQLSLSDHRIDGYLRGLEVRGAISRLDYEALEAEVTEAVEYFRTETSSLQTAYSDLDLSDAEAVAAYEQRLRTLQDEIRDFGRTLERHRRALPGIEDDNIDLFDSLYNAAPNPYEPEHPNHILYERHQTLYNLASQFDSVDADVYGPVSDLGFRLQRDLSNFNFQSSLEEFASINPFEEPVEFFERYDEMMDDTVQRPNRKRAIMDTASQKI